MDEVLVRKITSKQLSWLLKVPEKDARKIILRARRKAGEDIHEVHFDLFTSDVNAPVEAVSKEVNADVDYMMKDLYENSLKRSAFKK
jgi:hypothetical protein